VLLLLLLLLFLLFRCLNNDPWDLISLHSGRRPVCRITQFINHCSGRLTYTALSITLLVILCENFRGFQQKRGLCKRKVKKTFITIQGHVNNDLVLNKVGSTCSNCRLVMTHRDLTTMTFFLFITKCRRDSYLRLFSRNAYF